MATTQLDPRIARTRRMLQSALLDLAREQPLDEITVAEIADRAEVNRSSFYQHYSDKETLLADALDAQAAAVGADLSSLDAAMVPGDPPPELLLRYTRHVFAHAALYRLALGEHGSSIAVARLRNRIAVVVMAGYAQYGQDEGDLGMPVELAAASIAGSLLGMLIAWLESTDPVPPEQMAVWIWNALARPRC
ncbi:TetR/AcrR family transcriptional regulator [Cellulomonas sp. WB94]|uniref:TetR/AcrR family transcriptional regulator n=1 Tax=Cellulomonas sp. WB94 TaxID=2173174 RepID=UPI000D587829|nr:TetR/AcrR family transcriptional regulator [Cellulomonas sp. WB94]PVU82974.1 TetR/AcrR family transcriptional regulator [Cellulomonas sp. WB94]